MVHPGTNAFILHASVASLVQAVGNQDTVDQDGLFTNYSGVLLRKDHGGVQVLTMWHARIYRALLSQTS